MKCGQVKLSEYKRLQQMDQFNWVCPACFLTALPFADASILSDEGESVLCIDTEHVKHQCEFPPRIY